MSVQTNEADDRMQLGLTTIVVGETDVLQSFLENSFVLQQHMHGSRRVKEGRCFSNSKGGEFEQNSKRST